MMYNYRYTANSWLSANICTPWKMAGNRWWQ